MSNLQQSPTSWLANTFSLVTDMTGAFWECVIKRKIKSSCPNNFFVPTSKHSCSKAGKTLTWKSLGCSPFWSQREKVCGLSLHWWLFALHISSFAVNGSKIFMCWALIIQIYRRIQAAVNLTKQLAFTFWRGSSRISLRPQKMSTCCSSKGSTRHMYIQTVARKHDDKLRKCGTRRC